MAEDTGMLMRALGGVGNALENPNTLKLMANLGASIDPQGIGAQIGLPTAKHIEGESNQKAAGVMWDRLLKQLGSDDNTTSVTLDRDGGLTIKGGAGEGAKDGKSALAKPDDSVSSDDENDNIWNQLFPDMNDVMGGE